MNKDWITAALHQAAGVMARYPAGAVVWHRASGVRMIVDGWTISGDGQTLISTTDGRGKSTCFPFELSPEMVSQDDEGSEWKAC